MRRVAIVGARGQSNTTAGCRSSSTWPAWATWPASLVVLLLHPAHRACRRTAGVSADQVQDSRSGTRSRWTVGGGPPRRWLKHRRRRRGAQAVPRPVHGPVYRPVVRSYSYPYYWRSIWWAGYGYPWGFHFAFGYPFYGYPYYGYPISDIPRTDIPIAYGYYPTDITTAVRLQMIAARSGGVRRRLLGGRRRRLRRHVPAAQAAARRSRDCGLPRRVPDVPPEPLFESWREPDDPASARAAGARRDHGATAIARSRRLGRMCRGRPRPMDGTIRVRDRSRRPSAIDRPEDEPRGRFGTLSIRVQPADAEILVDGERWTAPADSSRIAIELAQGRHTVEVRKSGFSTYREDVLIRPGATMNLNVSLTAIEVVRRFRGSEGPRVRG